MISIYLVVHTPARNLLTNRVHVCVCVRCARCSRAGAEGEGTRAAKVAQAKRKQQQQQETNDKCSSSNKNKNNKKKKKKKKTQVALCCPSRRRQRRLLRLGMVTSNEKRRCNGKCRQRLQAATHRQLLRCGDATPANCLAMI